MLSGQKCSRSTPTLRDRPQRDVPENKRSLGVNMTTLVALESEPRGFHVLHESEMNKDTAFTEAERTSLGLEGLLPPSVETIDTQQQRVLRQLGHKTTDIERYIYLMQLLD